MTALNEYLRLESPGLWRPAPDAQRREVVVMFRDATLVLADPGSDRPLAHWSMPALRRLNPGKRPAVYTPGEGPDESLEIEDELMVAAIEKLHRILAARRPHPGRLRMVLALMIALVLAGLAVFWLPGALVRHAALVAPDAKRVEIGRAVLAEVETLTGAACHNPISDQALSRLAKRLTPRPTRVAILPAVVGPARLLPGGMVIAGRSLIDGQTGPEALAGHLIAAGLTAADRDPLLDVLHWAGMRAAFRLLTTGQLPDGALNGYGTALLTAPVPRPADAPLIEALKAAQIPAAPYAATLGPDAPGAAALRDADPFKDSVPDPVLSDAEWAALQTICP